MSIFSLTLIISLSLVLNSFSAILSLAFIMSGSISEDFMKRLFLNNEYSYSVISSLVNIYSCILCIYFAFISMVLFLNVYLGISFYEYVRDHV